MTPAELDSQKCLIFYVRISSFWFYSVAQCFWSLIEDFYTYFMFSVYYKVAKSTSYLWVNVLGLSFLTGHAAFGWGAAGGNEQGANQDELHPGSCCFLGTSRSWRQRPCLLPPLQPRHAVHIVITMYYKPWTGKKISHCRKGCRFPELAIMIVYTGAECVNNQRLLQACWDQSVIS